MLGSLFFDELHMAVWVSSRTRTLLSVDTKRDGKFKMSLANCISQALVDFICFTSCFYVSDAHYKLAI